MTIKTLADLRTEFNTNIADNTTGDISPEDIRNAITNTVDSMSYQDINTSGGLDFDGALVIDLNHPVQTLSLDGHVTDITTEGRSASKNKSVKVLLDSNGADRNLAFSSSWEWIGTKPSGISNTDKGLLTMTNFGSAETDIVAAYQVLGDGS